MLASAALRSWNAWLWNKSSKIFEVNFFGVVRLIQAVLPGMKARQGGYIGHYINVRGLGKSMVVFRLFEKLIYSNERSTIF